MTVVKHTPSKYNRRFIWSGTPKPYVGISIETNYYKQHLYVDWYAKPCLGLNRLAAGTFFYE